MIFKQLACDVCHSKAPLREILDGNGLALICEPCWEDMLARAGDE